MGTLCAKFESKLWKLDSLSYLFYKFIQKVVGILENSKSRDENPREEQLK